MREELNAETRRFTRAPSAFAAPPESGKEGHASPIALPGEAFKRSVEFDKRVAAFRYGSGETRVTYAELVDTSDRQIQVVDFNQEVRIRVYVESSSAKHVSVNFGIRDDKKMSVTGCGFGQVDQELLATCAGGRYLVEYGLRLPLQEGNYSLLIEITSPLVRGETAEFVDVIEDAVVFQVKRWMRSRVWSKVHLFPSLRLCTIG
jgi:lipopolysaccharide transport system ATP-binding protein